MSPKRKVFYKKDYTAEFAYQAVANHLQTVGSYPKIIKRFRTVGLRTAISRFLKAEVSKAVSAEIAAEELGDFDDVDSWLNSLSQEYLQKNLDYSYSLEDIREAKLREVTEDVQRLGFVLVEKPRLKQLEDAERRYWEKIKKADGYPLDLVY